MENIRKKLLIIGLLTVGSVLIILQIPESFVGRLLLPALVGMMYSPEVHDLATPVVSDRVWSLVILATPLIAFLIVMPLSSSVAYLGGLFVSVAFKSFVTQR